MPAQKDSQTKHTPTPWQISSSTLIMSSDLSRNIPIICNTMDLSGISEIGIHEAVANAELIVTAVNSHEELTQLLRDVLTAQGNQIRESHLDRAFKLGVLNSPKPATS